MDSPDEPREDTDAPQETTAERADRELLERMLEHEDSAAIEPWDAPAGTRSRAEGAEAGPWEEPPPESAKADPWDEPPADGTEADPWEEPPADDADDDPWDFLDEPADAPSTARRSLSLVDPLPTAPPLPSHLTDSAGDPAPTDPPSDFPRTDTRDAPLDVSRRRRRLRLGGVVDLTLTYRRPALALAAILVAAVAVLNLPEGAEDPERRPPSERAPSARSNGGSEPPELRPRLARNLDARRRHANPPARQRRTAKRDAAQLARRHPAKRRRAAGPPPRRLGARKPAPDPAVSVSAPPASPTPPATPAPPIAPGPPSPVAAPDRGASSDGAAAEFGLEP